MLLDRTRERVQVARAPVTAEFLPLFQGFARGSNRGVDVLRTALRNAGEGPRVRGIYRLEDIIGARFHPFAVDEMLKAAAMLLQPLDCDAGTFRCRPVLQALENFR